jgi:hypothetical protein
MHVEVGGSRLHDLQGLGQSTWLDCINHRTLVGSPLARLIRDGISGVDTNAVGLATAYAEDMAYRELVTQLRAAGADAYQIYMSRSWRATNRMVESFASGRTDTNTSTSPGCVQRNR